MKLVACALFTQDWFDVETLCMSCKQCSQSNESHTIIYSTENLVCHII